MKQFLPFFAIGTLIAVVLLFLVPVVGSSETIVKTIALILSLLTVIAAFMGKTASSGDSGAKAPVEQARKPAPSIDTKGTAEAEVVTLLARMQEKGRFIDFLMEDISSHDDKSVGAVARLVYQGCKEVLDDHFTVKPVETGKEGDKVTVPEGYDASLYRVTGNLSGSAPFDGTLVHKGWQVTSAKLPKVIASDSDDLPALAPAQVEV